MPRLATPLATGAFALLALLPSTAAAQDTCMAIAGSPAAPASWNSAATWSCGVADADGIPDADDNVVVNAATFTVILTQNEAANNLTLTPGSSGAPSFNSDRIRTAGFTLDVNGTYNTSSAGSASPINTTVSGGGRVRFVGAGRTFLGTNIAANYPAWRAEVATTGTSSFATGNLKFGALIVSSGTMDVTNDLRIDNGSDGSGDGITIASGATLIARGTTNRRTTTASTFGGPITVNGTLEMRGNTLNGNVITINGTFRRSTSTLAISNNNSSGDVFTYNPGAILEYTGTASRQSTGAEINLAAGAGSTNIIPNLVINATAGASAGINVQTATRISESLTLITGNITTSFGSLAYNSGATLVYQGTAAQTASASSSLEWPIANGPTNVTINNAAGVVMGASGRSVPGVLTFTNGTLSLGSNLLSIGTSGSIVGAQAGRHVVTNGTGRLSKTALGAAEFVFPVGPSAARYTPVGIAEAGVADNYNVRVSTAFTDPGSLGSQNVGVEWDITEAAPGDANATVTLAHNAADAPNLNEAGTVVVGHYNESTSLWEEFTAASVTATPYGTDRAYRATGVTSFSPFTVANAGSLPVELVAFTATAAGPGVARLAWTTASETDNAGFQAERQTATGAWTPAGPFVAGRGTTSEAHSYAVEVDGLTPGTHRFRLRQTDLDGATVTAASVEVTIGIEGAFALVVRGTRSADLTVAAPQAVRAALYDALGREVARLYDGLLDGQARLALPDGVAAGVYFLRITGERFATTRSLVLR